MHTGYDMIMVDGHIQYTMIYLGLWYILFIGFQFLIFGAFFILMKMNFQL